MLFKKPDRLVAEQRECPCVFPHVSSSLILVLILSPSLELLSCGCQFGGAQHLE